MTGQQLKKYKKFALMENVICFELKTPTVQLSRRESSKEWLLLKTADMS